MVTETAAQQVHDVLDGFPDALHHGLQPLCMGLLPFLAGYLAGHGLHAFRALFLIALEFIQRLRAMPPPLFFGNLLHDRFVLGNPLRQRTVSPFPCALRLLRRPCHVECKR